VAVRKTPDFASRVASAVCLASLGAAAMAAASAQDPDPLQNPQRPVFRAGTHVVSVDAYPVRDGRILEGLTVEDFEILEDGVPQIVETLQYVAFQPWNPEALLRDPNTVGEMFRLAADPRYRVFVLYYDVYHVPFDGEIRLRQPLRQMLDRMLGPRDLFGLLTPRQSPSQLTLGQQAETVQNQLSRIREVNTVGVDLFDEEEARLQTCSTRLEADDLERMIAVRRTAKVYRDLRDLVDLLGAIRQERKNIVLLSDGLVGPTLDLSLLSEADLPQPLVAVSSRGRIETNPRESDLFPDMRWCREEIGRLIGVDFPQMRRDVVLAARRANVAIHTVSPAGLAAPNAPSPGGYDLMSERTGSLLELSAESDGVARLASNDLTAALRAVADDMASYYVLGYRTTNMRWDGGLRRIEVRLKATGDRVRARREYRAPTEAEMAGAGEPIDARAPAPGPSPVDLALGALSRLRPDTELFTRGVAGPGEVAVIVELASGRATSSRRRASDVTVDVLDADDQPAGTRDGRIETSARSVLIRVPVTGVGPWQVAIRVGGAARTLTDRLEVAPTGTPLLGGPLVFRATPSGRSPLWPAADVRFGRTERVHVEWPVVKVPAVFEAALLNPSGDPLAVPVVVGLGESNGRPILTADVNLAPLAAGDYVIDLTASLGDVTERSLVAIRVTR
jgi:VWFA-related protein